MENKLTDSKEKELIDFINDFVPKYESFKEGCMFCSVDNNYKIKINNFQPNGSITRAAHNARIIEIKPYQKERLNTESICYFILWSAFRIKYTLGHLGDIESDVEALQFINKNKDKFNFEINYKLILSDYFKEIGKHESNLNRVKKITDLFLKNKTEGNETK